MNVRGLMKKVDGELVAVIKDGSQLPKRKVQAWSARLRQELGLPLLSVKRLVMVRDKKKDPWFFYVSPKDRSKTFAELNEAEIVKRVEVVDPRLTDPTAPAMNFGNKRRGVRHPRGY